MAYPYTYGGYPNGAGYYAPPMQDQLGQLRAGAYQPPMNQATQPAPTMPMAPSAPTASAQTNANSIIWVQGEEGAKAYLVAPNNTVQLWDSENQTIYLKSADASGMPSMRILDWTERTATPKPLQSTKLDTADYVTREEFNALAKELAALKNKEATKSKKAEKEVE